jgi:phage terminase large subunit-like protein
MSSNRFVHLAREYQAAVLDGSVPVCKWVRLACERNRRDRDRADAGDPTFPYEFDEVAAQKICLAAEQLPHIKGPKAKVVGRDDEGRLRWATIQLEPWQCWVLTTLFGWKRRDNQLRRFRQALILVPRKNAKSTMGAAIALYMLTADGEGGAECYSAATTRDQAKVVADILWEMVARSPLCREYFGVRLGAKTSRTLEVPATASKFAPLSADANTLDGLNISLAIVDELHAHKTRAVWDVLNTATGARAQPLLFAISTAGVNIGGICYELVGYLRKVLEGALTDETTFGIEYTTDEGDLWDSEATWRKANPNYGVSVNPADLARKATQARHSPASVNNFRTKHLNVWVQGESAWLDMDEWRACADPMLSLDRLAADKVPCWIGVDLAETRDIAALVALFRLEDGRFAAVGQFFLPESAAQAAPIAQYPGWVREGQLLTTDGNVADYQRIEDAILDWCARLNVQEIDFDRALAEQMQQRLMAKLGAHPPVVTVKQDVITMNPAMERLEQLVSRKQFVHSGDPVLTWMASNVVVSRNYKDEIYPRKAGGKDSHNKIDGIVALLTALSRAAVVPDPPKSYQMLILGRAR